jgi:hypothetical protein
MNHAFRIAGLCAAVLTGCERPTASNPPPQVIQVSSQFFYDLQVSVPPDPKKTARFSDNRLDWNLQGETYTAEKLPDGTFHLLRNGNLLGTAKAGDHVEFTVDGRLIHHPTDAK